jgi:GNAT superfamily N-acetyltransferase
LHRSAELIAAQHLNELRGQAQLGRSVFDVNSLERIPIRSDHIRPLRRGDLGRLANLVDENQMFPSGLLDDMTSAFFEGDPSQRWLVFDDGQVDAACYFVPEGFADSVWNLRMIAVNPRRHGKGLGTALMRHVEDMLAKEAVRMLLVDTSGKDHFKRTWYFYETLGYEQEARIRDYWARGDDKITFRKVLSQ